MTAAMTVSVMAPLESADSSDGLDLDAGLELAYG